MISLRLCLIAAAIVFIAIQTVSTLQCYHCETGHNCTSTKVNVTCDAGDDACVSLSGKDDKPYMLFCTNKTLGNEQCDTGMFSNCKVCHTDLCNSSSFNAPSIFTITIFTAVIAKMYF